MNEPVTSEQPSIEDLKAFYAAIDRNQLTRQLSPQNPYVYWTMELYDASNGLKGMGGLGVLAADTRRVAERLDVPMVVVTPFYPAELHQHIESGTQTETIVEKRPEDFGFTRLFDVAIRTSRRPNTTLSVYEKTCGSTRFVCINEPGFGMLYDGELSGDHRDLH